MKLEKSSAVGVINEVREEFCCIEKSSTVGVISAVREEFYCRSYQ